MPLTLQLVNETALPDGGPVSCHISGKRGIDIGRAAHLDWCLPDPTRYISSKHCEIRYKDGGYWLHDVSTNGTFVNGSDHRMHGPHRLRNGDRFVVGQYIVAVALEGDEAADDTQAEEAPPPVSQVTDEEWWATEGAVPPPIDPKELRHAPDRSPTHPDFLDWAADIPDPYRESSRNFSPPALTPSTASPTSPTSEVDWDAGPPSRVVTPPPPPPTVPIPRRPAPEPVPDTWEAATPAAAPPFSEVHDGPSAPGAAEAPDAFIRVLAKSAGLPEDVVAQNDPTELAHQIGMALQLLIANLMQLLGARQQAKRLARTADHTSIEAVNNNPLKFTPSPQDALRIMFGPANPSYLDAQRAIGQAFDDLKSHQLKTYSAMQHALTMIVADLDPKTIELETQSRDSGIGGLLQSRKAKLWDAFEARWQAKVGRNGGKPIEAFMRYFAEYYDRDGR